MDDLDLNGQYNQDQDGGGGEGPEHHMYQQRLRKENPYDSDEVERFGSASSGD